MNLNLNGVLLTQLDRSFSLGRAIILIAVTALLLVAVVALSEYQAAETGTAAGGNAIDGRSLISTGLDVQCKRGSECGPNNPAVNIAPSRPNGPKGQP